MRHLLSRGFEQLNALIVYQRLLRVGEIAQGAQPAYELHCVGSMAIAAIAEVNPEAMLLRTRLRGADTMSPGVCETTRSD